MAKNVWLNYLVISIVILLLGQTIILKSLVTPFRDLSSPIQGNLLSFSNNLKKFYDFIVYFTSLKSENEKLLVRIEDLEGTLAKLKDVEFQNRLLRDQANVMREKQGNETLILGRIVGRDFTSGAKLILNIGERDGVNLGSPVIYKNYLIGEVIELGEVVATVRTIFDPKFKTPVYALNTTGRPKGLLKGDFSTGITMEKILPGEEISVGDLVLTTGEGLFPPGFLVGKVNSVSPQSADILKLAKLSPLIELSLLEIVFVIAN